MIVFFCSLAIFVNSAQILNYYKLFFISLKIVLSLIVISHVTFVSVEGQFQL